MTTRQQWAYGFLEYCDWEASQEKMIALVAQASKEDSEAAFNPLDTEEPAPGATDYNPQGVKNYPDLESGYAATLTTFLNGDYPVLVGILGDPAGGSATTYATSVELNTWGTGNCLAQVEEIKSGDPQGYLEREVAGTAPTPVPPAPAPGPANEGGHQMIAPTPTGKGYYEVSPDGAVYAYGDAVYHGGANNPPGTLSEGDSVNGIAVCVVDGADVGYWLSAVSGAVFAYGQAPYLGGSNETSPEAPQEP